MSGQQKQEENLAPRLQCEQELGELEIEGWMGVRRKGPHLQDGDGVKGWFPILLPVAQLYLLGGFGKESLAMPIFGDGVLFMAHLLVLVPV